ncbi:HAMP domain-containing histidine kinase [Paenibacillus sp. SYP-B3998]|uniref:histidine kinase n=1 Tax=Paenibacillus sp. SYP-B3998 TaxID=2678564 RepID=A0A6G4A3V2_9BACL|nr:sensor histidine kinase [Paenibacillus sp. SYP-B3998]NEW08968.1 HAMP domain-containing histidine kinase [Paenibacillus sp. SYP-B3998]
MRLFIRSHLSVLVLVVIQGVFIFGYYWFLGFQQLNHLMYVFFVQIFLVCLYFCYRWIQDHRLYEWLSDHKQRTEMSIPHLGSSSFSEALYEQQLAKTQHVENRIQQVHADLEARVTFMNQWVHQMKTPVSVIDLMIQDEDEEPFQDIRKELYRLEEGLKTVLYSSRLSLFEKDYFIEKIGIQTLLDEIIMENKRLFIQNKVFPKKVYPVEAIGIVTDKKWLGFAISQLITNAVKYSAMKSDTFTLQVEQEGQQIVLRIEDFGIGIPPYDLKRVFDPYFTGVNGRLYPEATGMGLYLAKEILYKLGHRMELDSELGKGTVCKIFF